MLARLRAAGIGVRHGAGGEKYGAPCCRSPDRGRIRSEAAFARLAGVAPIPASSGQTIRYRLDRSGDRQLNRALHQILITRRRIHQPTIAYIQRRISEGKTRREANRCLKRYLARNLYRLLENGAPQDA
jgi:transposase